jgi:ribosome-binding protein aMBF1 (putative translation factor)
VIPCALERASDTLVVDLKSVDLKTASGKRPVVVRIIDLSPKVRFGKRLRQLRTARGLSQEALARSARIDRTYVSSCERGLRNISLDYIHRLANALRVPPPSLLEPPESS